MPQSGPPEGDPGFASGPGGDPGAPVLQLVVEPGGKTFTASLRPEDNGWLSDDLAYDHDDDDEGWPFIEPPEDFTEPPWAAWLRADEKFRTAGRETAKALSAAESAPFKLARPGHETITTCLGHVFSAATDNFWHAALAAWAANQMRLAEHGILRWDQSTGTVALIIPADQH